jgi:hypothetical protein
VLPINSFTSIPSSALRQIELLVDLNTAYERVVDHRRERDHMMASGIGRFRELLDASGSRNNFEVSEHPRPGMRTLAKNQDAFACTH